MDQRDGSADDRRESPGGDRRDSLSYTLIRRVWTIGVGRPGHVYRDTCEAFVHGRKAILYSLTARGFYEVMVLKGREIMEQLQVRELEAYVSSSHLRLARSKLKKVADQIIFNELGPDEIDGHTMHLLNIGLRPTTEQLIALANPQETLNIIKRTAK